jgi:hypothetical protein
VHWRKRQITLALAALSALTLPCPGAQPPSVSADRHSLAAQGQDSSGRQIAAIIPSAGNANAALRIHPAGAPSRKNAHKQVQSGTGTLMKVPPSLDEAADYCTVTARQLGKLAADKAVKVGTWFTAMSRQMTSSPAVTPSGMPYESISIPAGEVQRLSCDNRNWYMPDGRLKRLVQR